MNRVIITIALVLICISCSKPTSENDKIIKIALRDIGDKILLSNNDSISVVQPVKSVNESIYQLTFEKPLIIHPDSLVNIVKRSFDKANLSEHYITEVLECAKNEVAYSYEMKFNIEESLIPCSGRQLQSACYTIQIQFLTHQTLSANSIKYIGGILIVLLFLFIIRKFVKQQSDSENANFKKIGSFLFYADQNKLIKEAEEIALSKKECELLSIFISKPNEIIKREELTKRVWEDNGVVVGRSLDTYISKLRKKLQKDESIKLTNIHGIGYKLEVN